MSNEWSLTHSTYSGANINSHSHTGSASASDNYTDWETENADADFNLEAPLPLSELNRRDALIFLIDTTSRMWEPLPTVKQDLDANADDYIDRQPASEETPWTQTCSIASFAYRHRIISAPADYMGVVLMGTEKYANPMALPGIQIYSPLAPPTAQGVRRLQQLTRNVKFQPASAESSMSDSNNHASMDNESIEVISSASAPPLEEALSVCLSMFQTIGITKSSCRVCILTACDSPFGDDQHKQRTLTRANDLNQLSVVVQLFPFATSFHEFDFRPFYEDFIRVTAPYLLEDAQVSRVKQENRNKSVLDISMFASAFDDLRETMLRKSSSRRTLGYTPFNLGNHGPALGVSLYCLFHEEKKESAKPVNKLTNAPVSVETRYLSLETAAYVGNAEHGGGAGDGDVGGGGTASIDTRRTYTYGGERVFFKPDEVAKIKASHGIPSGLSLIGFRPQSSFVSYHNVRSPYFLYPAEDRIQGSRRAFHALLTAMSKKKVYAICTLNYRRNVIPRMVALWPSLPPAQSSHHSQSLDDNSTVPSGAHIIFLPFAEDVRSISLPPTAIAEPDLVDSAKKIVRSLRIPKYVPSAISNPALQQHYANLHAFALEEPLPQIEDELQPDRAAFDKHAAKFETFNESAFQNEQFNKQQQQQKASTRTREPESAEDKEFYTKTNWKALATCGGLKKLTIPQLKIFCRQHSLPLAGRKDQLVERIEACVRGM